MAYLSNLQEPVQSTTQGALFSWPGYLLKKYEDDIRPNRSITLRGPLESESSWAYNFAEDWRTEAGFAAITQVPLLFDFATIGELWKIFSAPDLIFRVSIEENKQIEEEEGTLTSKSSQSKFWKVGYSWILTLQDLSVTRQIWEARSALVHISSNAEGWKDWSTLTMLSHDILGEKIAWEEIKPSTISGSLINIQPLEQLFVFRRPTEVRHFLEENPFLGPLLKEAYINIREYFPSSEIFLEVVADPEAFDEEQLVIFIPVTQDPDGASEALNQLDQNWWLDAMERSQDKLCITLEFR
jgi:hypothetical protein